jgi:hypothetical protein
MGIVLLTETKKERALYPFVTYLMHFSGAEMRFLFHMSRNRRFIHFLWVPKLIQPDICSILDRGWGS